MIFGDYLKTCREYFGITQNDLVKELYLFDDIFSSLEPSTLSKWENLSIHPTIKRRIKIIQYFQQHTDYALPCIDLYKDDIQKTGMAIDEVKKLMGKSKSHIMNLPSNEQTMNTIQVCEIDGSDEILQYSSSAEFIINSLTGEYHGVSAEKYIEWYHNQKNLFIVAKHHTQCCGLWMSLHLKPSSYNEVLAFDKSICNIDTTDFAVNDEVSAILLINMFALNDTISAKLFSHFFTHVLIHSNQIQSIGSLALRKDGKKVLENIGINESRVNNNSKTPIFSHHTSLSDLVLKEQIVRCIFPE